MNHFLLTMSAGCDSSSSSTERRDSSGRLAGPNIFGVGGSCAHSDIADEIEKSRAFTSKSAPKNHVLGSTCSMESCRLIPAAGWDSDGSLPLVIWSGTVGISSEASFKSLCDLSSPWDDVVCISGSSGIV